MLPVVSKKIEKIIQIQKQEYLGKDGLLYKSQSCFHANFSTDFCLVQLTDFILREMDKWFHTGMILIHLQKAFIVFFFLLFFFAFIPLGGP